MDQTFVQRSDDGRLLIIAVSQEMGHVPEYNAAGVLSLSACRCQYDRRQTSICGDRNLGFLAPEYRRLGLYLFAPEQFQVKQAILALLFIEVAYDLYEGGSVTPLPD